MPAFSFEKIAPPVRLEPIASIAPIEKKPRGVIVQMLDRLVVARLKRDVDEQATGVIARNDRKPPA